MSDLRRRITLNIIFLSSSQGLGILFAIIYDLKVPQYLGPFGLGTLALIGAIGAVIGVVAGLGRAMLITREVARDPQAIKRLVGPAIILGTLISIIGWVITIIVMNLIGQPELTLQVIYVVAASNILGTALSPINAALSGMDKMQFSIFGVLIGKGLNTLIVLVAIAFGLDLVAIVACDLITTILTALLSLWLFFRYGSLSFNLRVVTLKELFRGGFAFFIVDVTFNLYLYLDTILLSVFTNKEVVGWYNLSNRLFGTLMLAPLILGQALLPSLTRLAANSEQQAASQKLQRISLHFLICVSLPVAAGTTVMAEPVIHFFYGVQFDQSIPVLIILSWMTSPTYLGIALYQILVAQGKQKEWAKVMILAFVVNLCLNSLLIPLFQNNMGNGAVGAAVSLLITEIVNDLFGFRLVKPSLLDRDLGRNVLKSLIVTAIMALVIFPLRNAFLLIPIGIGVLVYCTLGLFVFRLVTPLKQLLGGVRTVDKKTPVIK